MSFEHKNCILLVGVNCTLLMFSLCVPYVSLIIFVINFSKQGYDGQFLSVPDVEVWPKIVKVSLGFLSLVTMFLR